jgi:hypothetical protein
MSLPFSEPRNARQMAAAATTTGRIHDVVVGASKLLHGAKADDRDRAALRWALQMLDSAASKDVVFAMPSSQQLATTGTTVSALRRAARSTSGNTDAALAQVRDGLRAALRGRRDARTMEAVSELSGLFAVVSRIVLQSEVLAHGERDDDEAWPRLARTSLS